MGTKLALALATLHLHFIEQDFFLQSRDLIPTIYRRYIDDIFIVWEQYFCQGA